MKRRIKTYNTRSFQSEKGTELFLSASVNKKIETSIHKPQVTVDILKLCAHVFLIVSIDLIYIS